VRKVIGPALTANCYQKKFHEFIPYRNYPPLAKEAVSASCSVYGHAQSPGFFSASSGLLTLSRQSWSVSTVALVMYSGLIILFIKIQPGPSCDFSQCLKGSLRSAHGQSCFQEGCNL
jgi:hypothetical protein